MRLRSIALIAAVALSVCPAARSAEGQPQATTHRIAFLGGGGPAPLLRLLQALQPLGYAEGRNLVVERRLTEGKVDRLPALAAELVALKVDLIVTNGTPATRAAKQATSAIPIVFLLSADPVRAGLVESLARPGGNLTGWARGEFDDKHVEILKEVVEGLSRVAVLRDANYGPGSPRWPAAERLGLQVRKLDVRSPNDFDSAFAAARRWSADGLVVDDSPLYGPHFQRLADLAIKNRLPAIGASRTFAESGGFLYYGPKLGEAYPQLAGQIAKILKGARPADLPVEQPAKFELVINMKTAKRLGLIIPSPVLARADELIN